MDEISFKKPLFALALLIAAAVYVHKTYTLDDALAYAKERPEQPVSEKIEYYVGMIHYVKDRFPEAAGAFDQLLTAHPTSYYAPKALLRLGSSYQAMGRWEKAREAYEVYLERYPKGADADIVKRKYEYVKFK